MEARSEEREHGAEDWFALSLLVFPGAIYNAQKDTILNNFWST
jgi:hypothetical protein